MSSAEPWHAVAVDISDVASNLNLSILKTVVVEQPTASPARP